MPKKSLKELLHETRELFKVASLQLQSCRRVNTSLREDNTKLRKAMIELDIRNGKLTKQLKEAQDAE